VALAGRNFAPAFLLLDEFATQHALEEAVAKSIQDDLVKPGKCLL
jgi:hypothetical protein